MHVFFFIFIFFILGLPSFNWPGRWKKCNKSNRGTDIPYPTLHGTHNEFLKICIGNTYGHSFVKIFIWSDAQGLFKMLFQRLLHTFYVFPKRSSAKMTRNEKRRTEEREKNRKGRLEIEIKLTEILSWKSGDGWIGILPPARPNFLSRDC